MDLNVFTQVYWSPRIAQNSQSFPAGGRINADNLLIPAQFRYRNTDHNGVNVEPGLTIQWLFRARKGRIQVKDALDVSIKTVRSLSGENKIPILDWVNGLGSVNIQLRRIIDSFLGEVVSVLALVVVRRY